MNRDLDDIRKLDAPLIVFAGPALSHTAGLPSRPQLVAALLDEAKDYLSVRQHEELQALAAGPELADVFSELERALTSATFGGVVERLLDDEDKPVPALARALARLGPRLRGVITPNLDLLLERAFEGQLVVHPKPVADLASRKGWLLKIHGTLHDRASWVLTTEQRGQVMYRDPLHRELFRSLFMAHPILFVGVALDDPILTELTEQIRALAQGQPPSHWALVEASSAGPINRRKFAAAGIRLIAYDNDDGTHLGCVRMLEELGGDEPAVSNALPPPIAAPAPAPPAVTPTPSAGAIKPVLFLAANPAGTDPLRVDRELRVIRDALERSRHRGSFEFEIRTAATVHDLRRALLDKDYGIVHISGHGEQAGLLLEDEQGQCVEVPKQALARLFARHAAKGSLRCVLLNACWSLSIGESPSMSVPFTIAMDGPISDVAAIEFSRGFYDALGAGMDIAEAHEEGMTCVDLVAPGAKFDCQLLREA
ncbi:SIR2 family protein [Enhygromyxa salina]|uniref:CHAT domain protein n=1 Tax=Enhygromyxa salina TaxID=215803 RepID=A0A2S9YRV8_9BACT|nr:SIR2 family protein [Enhygromyxa salina]PRQ07833.1 CHAT domain protein [Enhygromyxa salina]